VDKKAIAFSPDGIDSPDGLPSRIEAEGTNLVAITYDNEPFSSPENLEITKRILMRLSELHERPMKLYVIKNGENLRQIIGTLSPRTRSYVCVLCKRAMVRLANDIAEREGAAYLVTGENLGQVASRRLTT
jgi:thiamine biosynthesis protein ThiI